MILCSISNSYVQGDKMELKYIFSFGFSTAALLISFTSLYFSLWYKKTSMVGALACWNPTVIEEPLFQTCEITLSNNGNKEFLVRDVLIDYEPSVEGELVPMLKTELPLVLKAGEIKLLRLNIPNLFMEKAQESGSMMQLEFHIIDLYGRLQLAEKSLTPHVEGSNISRNDWIPFKLRKVKP